MQWPFQGFKMRWRVSGSQAYLAVKGLCLGLYALNAPCKMFCSMTLEER